MSHAVRKSSGTSFPLSEHLAQRLKEGILIAAGGIALFLLIALLSYHPADPGWSHAGSPEVIHNQGGLIGAWIADIALYLFGQFAYLMPPMALFAGWLVFREGPEKFFADYFLLAVRFVGTVFTLVTGCALAWIRGGAYTADVPHQAGGILGDVIGRLAFTACGSAGGVLMLVALFLTGVTLFTGLSWTWLMDRTGAYALAAWEFTRVRWDEALDWYRGQRARRAREAVVKEEVERKESRPPPRIEPRIAAAPLSPRLERERQEPLFERALQQGLPELALLDTPRAQGGGYSAEALEAMSRQVELKLKDFNIDVEVVAVHPGPVITRFELEPAPGIKASRITNLAKDLARSLSTISVRVVEVIPGKTCIGLEIPNEQREIVSLSDILKSDVYERSASKLTMALGKDIAGQPTVVDLAKMPHLLVAGTTGAGKSVALNAMILSLLYKSTPDDVRLIMIDPKMLELSVYEGIPALLAPVVTDMKEAANALRWCVAEMERRYKLMAALGVRNIGGYNRKVEEAAARGQPIPDPLYRPVDAEDIAPGLTSLPYIVVIIDELADMMMVVGKKVEELIARLAQKARAAGVHLILATQRPSVDVITGLIKANIPSRIAFQVSSRIDSRTILDQMGAENLLGHGDMLYLPPGTGIPNRVHGAFVSDDEVHKVVERLKEAGEPEYVDAILNGPSEDDPMPGGGGEFGDDGEQDELYDQAVRIVTETRRASVSGIQRRLKIGYNRAARMVEEMERAGVVGELQSNGSREVLAPPPPKD
ncbi:MAG: DNA translocase FtsK 4TM domain-containing protein [Gammaproteobacteria bacterium]|nr:DNA translocase FtsK 4TM domain-containing protein [Gammaproteobacteria bacterium]MCP5202469.1 DNA translocase FtsK 4TM domain-containing protein [Gammaproteobacteria bacterium]